MLRRLVFGVKAAPGSNRGRSSVPPLAPRKGWLQVIGERCVEVEVRTGTRMSELQIGGVQKLTRCATCQFGSPRSVRTAEPPLASRGVRGITHNRVPQVQQVDANLVRSPGIQLGTEQIGGAPPLQALEVGPRSPAALLHHCHAGSLRWVAAERRIDRPGVFRHVTPARRKVRAADVPLAQLIGETAVGGIMLRYQHQARGIPIQPVNDAGPENAPDSGQVAYSVQQTMHQRAGTVPRCRVDYQSRGLVDHQDISILVDDVERDRLGNQSGRLGGRELNLDAVTRAGEIPLPRRRTV